MQSQNDLLSNIISKKKGEVRKSNQSSVKPPDRSRDASGTRTGNSDFQQRLLNDGHDGDHSNLIRIQDSNFNSAKVTIAASHNFEQNGIDDDYIAAGTDEMQTSKQV